MKEIWKDVVGYEGLYEVSDCGNVRSLPRVIPVNRAGVEYELLTQSKVLRPQKMKHGYVGVWLYGKESTGGKNGKQYSVHRLVAEAFCEKRPGADEVNHINEIKSDNRACNLEWCTHQENSAHGTRGQRIGAANLNGKKSKPVLQFSKDGELIAEYPSLQEVSRVTGYKAGNICRNIHGKGMAAYGYVWRYANDA